MIVEAHFTLSELLHSDTAQARGIDNSPTPEHERNLQKLIEFLEQVRSVLGDNPMIITSGYRSAALNKAVGGAATSSHAEGLAADFHCPGFGTDEEVCKAIETSDLKFDQLIFEQAATYWVHIGIGPKMRRQVLSWSPRTGYRTGIVRL